MIKKSLITAVIISTTAALGAAFAQDPAPAVGDAHEGAPGAEAVGGLRNIIDFDMGSRNIKAILIDGRTVWLGTSSGLVKYDTLSGAIKTYDNRTGLLSNGVFYLSRVGDEIWIGTYGGGLSILNPATEKFRDYNIQNGLGDAFIYDALRLANGDVWIATWSGANLVKGGDLDNVKSWNLFTVKNTAGGLPNDWVYGLAAGKNGEVWFATEGGLARYKNGAWKNWTHAAGLGADYESVKDAIDFDSDPGKVSSHHARQKADEGIADIPVAYNPNYIVALTVDGAGAVWAGTWGAGLSKFDGGKFTTYTVADGLPGNHIFALEALPDGRLLIGGDRGAAVFDGKTFTHIGVHEGLNITTIFSLAASGKTIWMGGYGGATWLPNGVDPLILKKGGAQ
ncbi:MAG TPA: two-component regulator propeller domain-containing protein [Parvularculaceae bacterium]|nr:two-component regulator propeller domain-containing protein [Parvularculaceae bacterium]